MKKIKRAYLLLGMGIGIILVSILYSLCPQVKYRDLNDEMIIERAKELGYISLKESILKEKKIEQKMEAEEVIEEKEESVEITIVEGDSLSDIAEKLLNAGLINRKDEFISLAEEKMVDKKFSYGVFHIKYNTSYSSIIQLLIR